MEMRHLRRRHLTSPNKSLAKRYLGTDFDLTPPAQKRRKTEPSPKKDCLSTRSFYGGREKKSFPHSPGRRKAVQVVLKKLSDENTDSDSDMLCKAGKLVSSENRKKKLYYEFHSTSTSDSTDTEGEIRCKRPLREKYGNNKVPIKNTQKGKTAKSNDMTKGSSKSTGNLRNMSLKENTAEDQTSPMISGRKFFKTRSPGHAALQGGGIVGRRGFDLKFVARPVKVSDSQIRGKKDKSMAKVKPVHVPTVRGELEKEDGTPKTNDFESVSNLKTTLDNHLQSYDNNQHSPEYIATRIELSELHKDSAVDTGNSSELYCSSVVDEKENSTDTCDLQLNENNTCTAVEEEMTNGYWESDDLFSAPDSGRITPTTNNTPNATESCTPVSTSETGSPISLLSVDSDSVSNDQGKKLFPIFMKRVSPSDPSQKRKLSLRSSVNNSPRISPLLRNTKRKDNLEQMVIDAGQKKFGVTQCDVCGMVYNIADPEDEQTHVKYHQTALAALKFPGWKKENVVQEYPLYGSRVIKVVYDSPKYALRKIDEINDIMSQELGSVDHHFVFRPTYQAFLYISDKKRVEGCCLAEPLTEGYPVVPDSDSSQSSQSHPGSRPWYCSETPVPAKVGISRIWVHSQARRKGIATKLLDCVRQWFAYGCVISKRRMAFSDPTQNGKTLAMNYTGTPKFLVYKFKK